MDIQELQLLINNNKTTFNKFLELLLKWNKTYNLTAITNKDEIWEKHFLDSITPLPFLPQKCQLLDIGAGGGFPGIPLKMVHPAFSITMLDSVQKKCRFCEAVIRELNLNDINVIHGRAEDKNIQNKLGKFDVIISRAVFPLKKLILNSYPYLKNNPPSPPFKKGGLGGIYNQARIIAMKGGDTDIELHDANETLSKLNLKVIAKDNYTLPDSNLKRTLIIIDLQ